jgi:YaiO family outer membrane protein
MKQLERYWVFIVFLWVLPVNGLLSQPVSGSQGDKGSFRADTLDSEVDPRVYMEQAGMEYQFHFFRKPWIRRWHVTTLRTDWRLQGFPVLAKINAGTLAGFNGQDDPPLHLQYQVDAYPRITGSDYMYLSAAFSGSKRFPKHYLGGEWYHSFSRGFEASLGFRWLRWRESVIYYTGSAGKYLGNYWLSLRAYVTPSEEFTGQTWTLSARRYLATGEDYLGLRLEYGTSPENLISIVDYPDIKSFRSAGAHLSYQRRLGQWLVKTEAGYRREEYREDTFRNHLSIRLHLLYQFNR